MITENPEPKREVVIANCSMKALQKPIEINVHKGITRSNLDIENKVYLTHNQRVFCWFYKAQKHITITLFQSHILKREGMSSRLGGSLDIVLQKVEA